MIRSEKFVLGLLVSLFIIPATLAGNRVIGTFSNTDSVPAANKGAESKDNTTDTKGPGDNKQATSASATKSDQTTGEAPDPQFDKKVADFLTRNPEIIVASLQKFQQKQQMVQQAKFDEMLMKNQSTISNDSSAIVMGKEDAEVKLVVFLDPNCPHCKTFTQTLPEVRNIFPNIGILIRYWPFLKNSDGVARGLMAIQLQGQDKFEAATKEIATNEGSYSLSRLLDWVKKNKLDVKKFEDDVKSKTLINRIQETKALAEKVGLEGTPTSLLVTKDSVRLVVPTDGNSLVGILKEATKT